MSQNDYFNPNNFTQMPSGVGVPGQGADCVGGPNVTANPFSLTSRSVCVVPAYIAGDLGKSKFPGCCIGESFNSAPSNNQCLNYCFYEFEHLPGQAGDGLVNCMGISFHDVSCYDATTDDKGTKLAVSNSGMKKDAKGSKSMFALSILLISALVMS